MVTSSKKIDKYQDYLEHQHIDKQDKVFNGFRENQFNCKLNQLNIFKNPDET